jgi:hypothetical protein
MNFRQIKKFKLPQLLLVACLLTALVIWPTGAMAEKSASGKLSASGFSAVISGAYEGKVSGKGTLQFLANAGFDRKGYSFLADGRGLRPHGITFMIPRGLSVGKHELKNPSPFDMGQVVSVRVDRDLGNATVSSQSNTVGFLHLQSFSSKENEPNGSTISGNFEFTTEDSQGEKIAVRGQFEFIHQ